MQMGIKAMGILTDEEVRMVRVLFEALRRDALAAVHTRLRSTGEDCVALAIILTDEDGEGKVHVQPFAYIIPAGTDDFYPPDEATTVTGDAADSIREEASKRFSLADDDDTIN